MKLTNIQRKADAVKRPDARKLLDDIFHFEERHNELERPGSDESVQILHI